MKTFVSTLLLSLFCHSLFAEEAVISLKQRVESADNIYFGFVSGVYYPNFHQDVEKSNLFFDVTVVDLDGKVQESQLVDTEMVHRNWPAKQMIIVAVKETHQGKAKKEIKASTGLYGIGENPIRKRVAVFENKEGAQAIILNLETYQRLINKEYLNDKF